jgi:hypothetical protein
MSYSKSLGFNLTGNTGDADEKLRDVEAKIEELTKRRYDLSLNLTGNKEASIQLREVDLALDKLTHKVATPHISITGIDRADLALDKLDLKMDRIGEKASGNSFFKKLSNIFGGLSSNEGWNVSKLFSGEAAEGAEGGLPALTSPIGVGAIASVVQLLGSLVPGLAGGATALGIGGAGLYGLSKQDSALFSPIINGVTAALSTAFGKITDPHFAGTNIFHGGAGALPSVIAGGSQLGSITRQLQQIGHFITTLGPGLGKLFAASIPMVLEFSKALEPAVKTLLPQLASVIKSEGPSIKILGSAFGDLIVDLGQFLKVMGPAMLDSTKDVKGFVDVTGHILVGLGYVFDYFATTVYMMGQGVTKTARAVGSIFDWLKGLVIESITGAVDIGLNIWDKLPSGLRLVITTAVHDVMSILDVLPSDLYSIGRDAVDSLISGFRSDIGGIGSVVSSALSEIPGVSAIGAIAAHIHMAQGGVITEPIVGYGLNSGKSYAFGESGREAVIPISAGRMNTALQDAISTGNTGGVRAAGTGSGDTYNFAFSGFVGNQHQVSLEIVQALRRYKKINGNQLLGIA